MLLSSFLNSIWPLNLRLIIKITIKWAIKWNAKNFTCTRALDTMFLRYTRFLVTWPVSVIWLDVDDDDTLHFSNDTIFTNFWLWARWLNRVRWSKFVGFCIPVCMCMCYYTRSRGLKEIATDVPSSWLSTCVNVTLK